MVHQGGTRWNRLRRRTIFHVRLILALYALFLSSGAYTCGPGRSGGRRRSVRKLTPLVFKQHVPNVAENSLAASGPAEDRITRDDPRFKDLVLNYNEDVVFKDRKGTGEDRAMTHRLREKLDTLAISVMNYWPSVRVRVTSGYDGEGVLHAPRSLHYCGRALDVGTSDRDPAKYGMLARLAVEAGFDWVYFESRSHVHCSVKREPNIYSKNIGCFHGNATVRTKNSVKLMRHLMPGDEVISGFLPNGSSTYHKVITFLHRDPEMETQFIRISLDFGDILFLTKTHLVFRKLDESTNPQAIFAEKLRSGDRVFTRNESGLFQLSVVSDVTELTMTGVYAPITESGTVVVDNVWTSCYAEVNHELAHTVMFPLRIIYRIQDMYRSFITSWYPDVYVPLSFIEKELDFNNHKKNSCFMHWYARLLTFVIDILPTWFWK